MLTAVAALLALGLPPGQPSVCTALVGLPYVLSIWPCCVVQVKASMADSMWYHVRQAKKYSQWVRDAADRSNPEVGSPCFVPCAELCTRHNEVPWPSVVHEGPSWQH